ncbi:RDD family protein [Myroides sp. LJL119]
MANLIINTTQNIPISFQGASLGKRIFAFLLDMVFKILYLILIGIVFTTFIKPIKFDDDFSNAAVAILFVLPVIIYSFAFEVLLQGYTPGKRILHIRVIKIDGYQPSVVDYFIRWIMRIVDIWSLTGILGLGSIIASDKNQRLGDMLAGTAVISQLPIKNGLNSTIYQEVENSYDVVYLQVLNLNDNDIRIIKQAYTAYLQTNNENLLLQLVDKIQSTIKIDKQRYTDKEFVEVVLKDYNYLTARV